MSLNDLLLKCDGKIVRCLNPNALTPSEIKEMQDFRHEIFEARQHLNILPSEDIGHLVGNPLFALETNLDTLRNRLEVFNKTGRVPYSELASVFEVLGAVERCLEKTKNALHEIKYPTSAIREGTGE